jgi:hypothetical protein
MEPGPGAGRFNFPQGHPMKKLIVPAFALILLGAGTAQALTIAIHTTHPRHRHCSWDRDHHQVCRGY